MGFLLNRKGIKVICFFFDLIFLRLNDTFLGSVYRGQGVLLLWLLLLFSLTSYSVKLRISPFILQGLIVLEFLLSFIISPSLDGRFIGTLGEPNSLAGFMLFLWPFALLTNKKSNKFIDIILFLLVLILIIGTGSRSGLIGLLLQILFVIFYRLLHLSFGKSAMIVVIFLLLSLGLPFFDNTSIYESRSLIWQTAIVSGLQSPILGHGFGNMQSVLHTTSQQLHNALRKENIDCSHNLILDWFVQAGIIGIICIMSLLVLSFKRITVQKNEVLLLSFLGLLSIMLFNPVSIVLLIGFWWIIGQTIIRKTQ